MGVDVDEAGRDMQTFRVDHLIGIRAIQLPHRGDDAILNADIDADAWRTRSIEYYAILDDY
jgi:hypothetical protein